jgi:hypothetical protein
MAFHRTHLTLKASITRIPPLLACEAQLPPLHIFYPTFSRVPSFHPPDSHVYFVGIHALFSVGGRVTPPARRICTRSRTAHLPFRRLPIAAIVATQYPTHGGPFRYYLSVAPLAAPAHTVYNSKAHKCTLVKRTLFSDIYAPTQYLLSKSSHISMNIIVFTPKSFA